METSSPARRSPSIVVLGLLLFCFALLLVAYPNSVVHNAPLQQQQQQQHRKLESAIMKALEPIQSTTIEESEIREIDTEMKEQDTESNEQQQQQQQQQQEAVQEIVIDFHPDDIQEMVEKLAPRELIMDETDNMTLAGHQFLHLHHMKTGGTSMDRLIECSMGRLKGMGYKIPYYNIHECSPRHYTQCVQGTDQNCRDRIFNAAIMSYCAPLKDLRDPFGWAVEDGTGAVTVFRHPVARAWSMYRFQTKSCYSCKPLKDIYAEIDNGTSDLEDICKDQLINHQTRNVLSKEGTEMENEELKVEEAIANMKRFFTMVGLTEDMDATHEMASRVFPWLAEQYEGSDQTCGLGKYNSSPTNNRCGGGNTHLPLPDVPDEETARIILEHNQLDMKVYEAAVEQFQLQKVALGL